MNPLQRFTNWLTGRKAVSAPLPIGGVAPAYADMFKTTRSPSVASLLKQFRETVYACAVLNSQAVASVPLKLYVTTARGQAQPKCATKALSPRDERWVRKAANIAQANVQQVEDHPILDILDSVNPWLNGFELCDLTQQLGLPLLGQ